MLLWREKGGSQLNRPPSQMITLPGRYMWSMRFVAVPETIFPGNVAGLVTGTLSGSSAPIPPRKV
jgi:hypothetical protein